MEIFRFYSGATRQRQQLLRSAAEHLPGFEFVRFDPGKPGVFVLRINNGPELHLVLAQVEVFVAAFRLGRATASARKPLPEGVGEAILAHQFS